MFSFGNCAGYVVRHYSMGGRFGYHQGSFSLRNTDNCSSSLCTIRLHVCKAAGIDRVPW